MRGIFTFLLLSISILSFAQVNSNDTPNIDIDDRLFDVYEQEYLTTLQKNNPFLLERWSFYLDNAFYITEYPSEKGNPDYPIVEIDNLEKFNILLLEKNQSLSRDFDKQMVYKIKNTNKVLVYFSGKKFNQKLNAHLKRG